MIIKILWIRSIGPSRAAALQTPKLTTLKRAGRGYRWPYDAVATCFFMCKKKLLQIDLSGHLRLMERRLPDPRPPNGPVWCGPEGWLFHQRVGQAPFARGRQILRLERFFPFATRLEELVHQQGARDHLLLHRDEFSSIWPSYGETSNTLDSMSSKTSWRGPALFSSCIVGVLLLLKARLG